MTEDLVKLNSQAMTLRVASKIAQEEEEMISHLAKQTVERITLSSIEKYMAMVEEQPRRKYRPIRSKSSEAKQTPELEKLIDRKVKLMIPTIIERVTAAVERRLFNRRLVDLLPQGYRCSENEEEEEEIRKASCLYRSARPHAHPRRSLYHA